MTRPRLVDFFSCAGGAAMGYHQAGWEVAGVDINPQPNYPFEFIQADALELLQDPTFLAGFDGIHASPTCQTRARVTAWRGSRDNHPDTLTPTLAALKAQRLPWIVENVTEAVVDSTMRADFILCGTQFGLPVRRHRAFEIGNWSAFELQTPCDCHRNPRLIPFEHKAERAFADAMGCHWMSAREARQALPPAYTHYLGRLMLAALAPVEVPA